MLIEFEKIAAVFVDKRKMSCDYNFFRRYHAVSGHRSVRAQFGYCCVLVNVQTF